MATTPLQQPGPVDLLKMMTNSLTGSNFRTTESDQAAMGAGFDPSSPDIVKTISATLAKLQAGGDAPDEETAKTMGAAFKAHLDFKAAEKNLQNLIKAYTDQKSGVQ